MDFDSYRKKLEEVGPHPGLSEWQEQTVLLYRCRDISEEEFRNRLIEVSDQFENLVEKGLPESLGEEAYQVAAAYYQAATKCLDSYLEGIEEILHWGETGDARALTDGRECFVRGDRELNEMFLEYLNFEKDSQEVDKALLLSMGVDPEEISKLS